jgi:DNA-directed RNA polymerase specialized sigma24 family protein
MSTPALQPRTTRKPTSVEIPLDSLTADTAESLDRAIRDEFIQMAYNERERLLASLPFEDQSEWLLEDTYWDAVAEIVKKAQYLGLTNPRAYLKRRVRSRIIDAIRKDARENRAFATFVGANVKWERGLPYRHFGKIMQGDDDANWTMKAVEDPGVVETFGYIDFVRWIRRQDRIDAEVLLQKSTTGITDTDLGTRCGRDRFWVKRVYNRMAKQLVRETGLFPHEIEGMVSEALRRDGPVEPLPVVHVKLGRWEGRTVMGFQREEKSERRASDRFLSFPSLEPPAPGI